METLEKKFLQASDVANLLDISVPSAYRIIKRLNDELSDMGKIVIPGKISRRYFEEKVYM